MAKKQNKRQIGRPRAYETERELRKAVEGYFNSISRVYEVQDELGAPVLNDDGEPIRTVQYVVPPTVSGLCLSLGIHARTWRNYHDRENYPDLAPIAEWADMMIQAFLEEQLLVRKKGIQGIIFNLKNNYGWSEKREIELGEQTRKELAAPELTLEEKLALIKEAALAFGGDGESADEIADDN